MKKQLQIEAVANGFLAREPLHGGVAWSPENTFVFSDASALGRWVAEYFGGPAPAPQEPTPETKPQGFGVLDLRRCVKGQRLRLRDGTLANYVECFTPGAEDGEDAHRYRHAADGLLSCSHDGRCLFKDADWDVVEIMPFEPDDEPKPVTEEQIRSLQPGDVVVLNTGERSTVRENDGTQIPIRTDRRPTRDETSWFHASGHLRCSVSIPLDECPRIVAIEKKK